MPRRKGPINVVYKIISKTTGQVYVGAATKFNQRVNVHRSLLRNNKHYNKLLQDHVYKYGLDDFEFTVLEENCYNLDERELFYIKNLNTHFNLNFSNRPVGQKRSEESKVNMKRGRMANSGYPKGIKRSPETCRKIGDAHKGKKLSEEHKSQMSKARKGKPILQETKNKISATMKGRSFTEEHKANLSKAMKGNKNGLKK